VRGKLASYGEGRGIRGCLSRPFTPRCVGHAHGGVGGVVEGDADHGLLHGCPEAGVARGGVEKNGPEAEARRVVEAVYDGGVDAEPRARMGPIGFPKEAIGDGVSLFLQRQRGYCGKGWAGADREQAWCSRWDALCRIMTVTGERAYSEVSISITREAKCGHHTCHRAVRSRTAVARWQ